MPTLKGSPFDARPIVVRGFVFKGRSAVVEDPKVKPTAKDWLAAIAFAGAAEAGSPYWVADLLNYAESRTDWEDRVDTLIAESGYARQTLLNISHVGRKVQGKARELAPTFSHAKAVASLSPADQVSVLTQARDDELTVSETSKAAHRLSKRVIAEGDGAPCVNEKHTWIDRYHTLAPVCERCGVKGVIVSKPYLARLLVATVTALARRR